jgi:P-type E1-E2 ATPase
MILDLPEGPTEFHHLVLDFTGTLSLDGTLLAGVAEALSELADHLTITVMTADTFGTAREALVGLPLQVRIIGDGKEKARLVSELGGAGTIAVGNGRNDAPMMSVAGLGIAVMGPEGGATELLAAAHVATRDILDALGLISNPKRLKATLRD